MVPIYVRSPQKPAKLQQLVNEALFILATLGIPLAGLSERRRERMALASLALADVTQPGDWANAKGYDGTRALKTRDIITYINQHFYEQISPGSYDDIRRKDLKLPVLAGIVISSAADPNAARNNPTRAYAIEPHYAALIRKFGGPTWAEEVAAALAGHPALTEQLAAPRTPNLIPVT